ncbi:hypothetical protein [Stenomitos frigidus]|nr:hypothetical protein [Stenomitos frigidus]
MYEVSSAGRDVYLPIAQSNMTILGNDNSDRVGGQALQYELSIASLPV